MSKCSIGGFILYRRVRKIMNTCSGDDGYRCFRKVDCGFGSWGVERDQA